MKIEIFKRNWSISDVLSSPEKIFIFGDNDERSGKGGQAIIRDLPNTYGIRTKKRPNNELKSFYSDSDLEQNKSKILEDILNIKSKCLSGSTIVFSSGGYGTGLANLKNVAPLTFDFLCKSLRNHLNFNNESGTKYFKIPSNLDISNGNYILIDTLNSDILQPINNSFFRNEYLSLNLNTTYDLIKNIKKVAFSSIKRYIKDDILIFYFTGKSKYLICKVLDSYLGTYNDSLENWSIFEGFDSSFIKDNINKLNNHFQIHFQYICSLDQSGKMNFKNDIFSDSEIETDEKFENILNNSNITLPKDYKTELDYKTEKLNKSVTNEDILDSLNQIKDLLIKIYTKNE